MTINEIEKFLYDWINLILNTEQSFGIEIIRGNRNAPRPDLPYIVIHDPPITNRKTSRGNWESTTDEFGNLSWAIYYETSISIEEVGGNGESFKFLLNSINRQDIKDLWTQNNISLLRNENILNISDITENYVERRTIMDIFVLHFDEGTYQPGFFETVEYEGTYIGKKT